MWGGRVGVLLRWWRGVDINGAGGYIDIYGSGSDDTDVDGEEDDNDDDDGE